MARISQKISRMRIGGLGLCCTTLAFLAVACGDPVAGQQEGRDTEVPADASVPPMPKQLHWSRNSAEYQALSRQAYGLALRNLEALRAAGTPDADGNGEPDPWAVVFDTDETLLSNLQFEKESWEQGLKFSKARWLEWVQRKAAPAMPGAVEFTQRVRELGGRVVVVTNRKLEAECEPTRENLLAEGIVVDGIFCQEDPNNSDKNGRFEAVLEGTTGTELPALDVLMFVGDNILDYPGLDQSIRTQGDAPFEEFGSRFVIIPNPLYGSWEKNPEE